MDVGPDGRLEVAASLPSEAERDERLKRVLHERLRIRAADLARMAGNEFFVLSGKARSLHGRLDRNFEDVDLLLVHLDIGELSRFADRGAERDGDTPFPKELSDALADVVQDGPGLTLDHADVEKLEERKQRAQPRNPQAQATHDRLSEATSQNTDAFGDRLRSLEERVLAEAGTPEAQVVQEEIHRNVFIRIGRWALATTGAITIGWTVNLTTPAIGEFIAKNWPLLVEIAGLYGPAFQSWFVGAVSSIPNLPETLRAAVEATRRALR
ncbi:MAG: hypothetical protein AAGB05_02015 [Pseudomonadota bacterium]